MQKFLGALGMAACVWAGVCMWAGCSAQLPAYRGASSSPGPGPEQPGGGPPRGPRLSAFNQQGKATWYGSRHHGGRTASGERFNMYALTAAHRSLRFGSLVRVENLRNGRAVVVRINDRGPFGRGHIIDLSYAAAQRLGMLDAGIVPVRLELVAAGR